MEEKRNKKITCPICKKTGNYKIEPNFCAYCGTNLQNHLRNHNK